MKQLWNKYAIKGFFGWESFKWHLREIAATFSNKPSYYSSKRIERALLFLVALSLHSLYFYTHRTTLTPEQVLLLTGPLFVFAGYSMAQTQVEKKRREEKEEPKTGDNNEETLP